MGRMMGRTFATIRALVARDLLDAVRNSTLFMSGAVGVALAVFIVRIVEHAPRFAAGELPAYACTAALCIPPAFTGCVMLLYVMAEERERGVCLTLAEAGVTPRAFAVSKWLAGTLAALFAQVVACLLLGFSPVQTLGLGAFALVVMQPLLLAGLACGLMATEQMSSSVLAAPLTLVAVAPILSFMSVSVRSVTWLLPLGPAVELVRTAQGLAPIVPVPVLFAVLLFWLIASGALAVWALRRYARQLAAERDRLA